MIIIQDSLALNKLSKMTMYNSLLNKFYINARILCDIANPTLCGNKQYRKAVNPLIKDSSICVKLKLQ